MIIIGEKINGTIPEIKKAIEEKDAGLIKMRAIKQAEAGADYLDICAGTHPDIEVETLHWLMDIVQETVDIPLCIDSPNPRAIEAVLKYAKKPGIINSVSDERDKCGIIYPLIKGTDWQVIALTCDDRGIAKDVETRVEIAVKMVEKSESYGIKPENILLDPLVIALATDPNSVVTFINTMNRIKEIYPTIRITSGLSNISYGLPLRRTLNRHFLTLTVFYGMDSAIMDPCDRDLITALLTTEALMGSDNYCVKYCDAFRKKKIGPNHVS